MQVYTASLYFYCFAVPVLQNNEYRLWFYNLFAEKFKCTSLDLYIPAL
jgi:hypothetical protein